MRKMKPQVKWGILVIVLIAIVAGVAHLTVKSDDSLLDARSTIRKVAEAHKAKFNGYGVVPVTVKSINCFSGDTFMKEQELQSLFTDGRFDNVSCVYKMATGTPVVEAWSVSLVKYGKNDAGAETATVQCVDSAGGMYETPGLTTSHVCNTQ